jgi:hypothetical protein
LLERRLDGPLQRCGWIEHVVDRFAYQQHGRRQRRSHQFDDGFIHRKWRQRHEHFQHDGRGR